MSMNSSSTSIDMTTLISDLEEQLKGIRNLEYARKNPFNQNKESAGKQYFYEIRLLGARLKHLGIASIIQNGQEITMTEITDDLRHWVAIRKLMSKTRFQIGIVDGRFHTLRSVERDIFIISYHLQQITEDIIKTLLEVQPLNPIKERTKESG